MAILTDKEHEKMINEFVKGAAIFIAPFDDWAIIEKVDNGMVHTQGGGVHPIIACRLDKGLPFQKPSELKANEQFTNEPKPSSEDVNSSRMNQLENQMVINNEY